MTPIAKKLDRRVSVAPMMEWTDRHERFFLRLIAPHVLLYTEMITTGAILRGDARRFLEFNPEEHPVALQLGGADPGELAAAARLGETYGYDEINLNCGCPSDRVQAAKFGACLMAEPELVADCVAAMRGACGVPVTVKTRIGIDDRDDYEFLTRFVETVAATGCDTFIIHARKAWLSGLSPKQNREIPPLRYDVAHRLKRDFPALTIVVNGGITTAAEIQTQLAQVDGVMIGREAYQNPYFLALVEEAVFGGRDLPSRHALLEFYRPYVERQLAAGVPLKAMTRHILGLFGGLPGARAWRRALSERAHLPGADFSIVRQAAAMIRDEKRLAA